MSLSELLLAELEQEAATTRKMLERVPENLFDWKPHEKSMALGQLAAHVANLFGTWFQASLSRDEFDLAESKAFRPESVAELLSAFDHNVADASELLQAQSDERMFETWTLRRGEQTLFRIPRWAVLRSMVFNHIIHHRGQLSVYLRLRDVPLPPVYGPTADEIPDALKAG
ncbi:MAG TPA: DinB family protein [Pyrinomonadaceae bacterium]|nr:DinB family protein [Pyrinomonadaceae bacterium]